MIKKMYVIYLFSFGILAQADIMLYAVNGYTPTTEGEQRFSALLIGGDGRIIALGDEALKDQYPNATRVSGGGAYLLPGLIDSHGHIHSLGLARTTLDLVGIDSLPKTITKIREYAKLNADETWILGRGWNQVLWENPVFPNAKAIDSVVSDRPVWLRRVDGHAGWANSRALALAGIDNDMLDPVGGKIHRDQHGLATGILIDAAMDLVDAVVPPVSKATIRRNLEVAMVELVSLGLTSVHDPGIDITTAEVYMSMAESGNLPLRVYAMLSDAGENLTAMGKPLVGYGADHLTIASVKLYADGALGSRGAALIMPYSDDPENRGLLFASTKDMAAAIRRSNNAGFQANIHAIGDAANRSVLDALDRVQAGKPSPLRNRIEHAQVLSLKDIPRLSKLGVIASMQPIHATSDMNMAEDRIGPARIAGAYAWSRMLNAGVVIAAGSDFPVEPPNPFLGLHAAVTRKDLKGLPQGGWYADQALTRAEALRAFTLDGAFAAHQENNLGSLEPGKWADFILLAQDYFTVPGREIADIEVLATYVAGQEVYRRQTREQLVEH